MKERSFLTINETANFLNLKLSNIRSMVFQKKIPYIKIGRLIRFNMEDLIIWVQDKKINEYSIQ